MDVLHKHAGPVVRLFLYLFVLALASCSTGALRFGTYSAAGEQKIKLAADFTFTYTTLGLRGDASTLSGTWARKYDRLLLHATQTDSRKMEPTVALSEATGAATNRLLIKPEVGVNVLVEVSVDGLKIGELTPGDSSFVFEGDFKKLMLKASATGFYAQLLQNTTLVSDEIDFSGQPRPVLATVSLAVSLRDFYKLPVEDSFLEIKSRQKLYWAKRNTAFRWVGPEGN